MEERVYSSEDRGVRRRAAWALLTVLMLFGVVEATLRLAIGPPPLPSGVARTQTLRLVQVAGGWVAKRGVDGQLRSFPKDIGLPRVGVLGGSSVMEAPIDKPENFPVWLQRALPEVQVLNLGSPGASSSGLALLAGELSVLNLDAVVVYTGHNDFGNLLMGGELDTSARWQIRAQQFLAGSWVHAGLRQLVVREPVFALHLNTREDRLVFTQSDQAQLEQGLATERLITNLKVLAQDSSVPVLWVPPISNLHHAPQGLRSGDPDCMKMAANMPRRRPERGEQRARELAKVCGVDTALGHWLRAHAAVARGDQAQALSHFKASLALDPAPLRMPLSARQAELALAAELGQSAVDLWGEQPIWPATHFRDTLHFSSSGAQRVAELIAPDLRALLDLPAETQERQP